MAEKLNEEYIYECLKSLNVVVRASDVKVPTKEFMIRVVVCFLKDLGIDLNSKVMVPWDASNHFEEAELYEEGQFLIMIIQALNVLLRGLEISIKDIVEPKPKRTKKILNHMLVFWKYYLKKCSRFREIEQSYASVKEKIASLAAKNIPLEEKYLEIQATLGSMPPKEMVLSSLREKEVSLNKLIGKKEQFDSDYQSLKAKLAEVKESTGVAALEIISSKQKVLELDQHILTSPEKLNSEVQSLKSKIKAEDTKLKEVENEVITSKKKLESLEKVHKAVQQASSALKDFPNEIENLEKVVKATVLSFQKLKEGEEQVRKLNKELKTKVDMKALNDQMQDNIDLKCKKQKSDVIKMINVYQSEIMKEETAIENLDNKFKKLQEQALVERDAIRDMKKKYDEAEKEIIEKAAEHKSVMNGTSKAFEQSCEEVIEMVKAKVKGI